MDESRGIKSVETGGRVLEALAAAPSPLELRQIAAAVGISTSLAHAYMTSFSRMGMVQQDPVTKRYALGELAIDIGLSGLRSLDPIGLALDAIGRLSRTVQQTVSLSVWGSHGPTVIRVHRGSMPLHSTLFEGSILSLRATATGLAFCAFLPPPVVARALALEGSDKEGRGAAFDAAVQEAREAGCARIVDLPTTGLASFSAPVFNHSSMMMCALTVTGKVGSFDTSWTGCVAMPLLDTAHSLSERLGRPLSARRLPAPQVEATA